MISHILMAMLVCISLCNTEIAPNGPLVYPSWPPKASSQKPVLHQLQSKPQQRHQMVYQMRPNPASSRYSSSGLLQSPSNLVYAQSKQRTYQPHMTMIMQPQLQTPGQHNRMVIRTSSPQMNPSSSSGLSHHFMMPSVKPASHHAHHMSSTATHPIFFKKPQMTPVVMKSSFHSPASGHKSGGEYVFENPFINSGGSMPTTSALTGSFSLPQKNILGTPSTSTLSVGNHQQQLTPSQGQHKYSPIHTISAPNLSLHEQKPFADFVNGPIETNYILEKDPANTNYPHIAFTPQRPSFQVHQYQVTEPTNDFTIRDGHTGKQTLYSPDTDPSLSSYQINPVSDTFSRPSFTQQQYGQQPAASALIQHQVFPSSTNTRQSNAQQAYLQPQPHLSSPIYEPQMEMQPAYNPTYLVTQSNQLLSHHKQHLFKPDPVYLQQAQQPAVRPDNEFLPSYQLQPSTANEEAQFPRPNHQISHPLDEPQFARLMAAAPIQHHHTIVHPAPQSAQNRPSLTEKEVSNLMNFGRLDVTPNEVSQNQQTGFVASSFFRAGPADSSDGSLLHSNPTFDDVFKHQQNNEERIVEATRQQALGDQIHFKHKKTGTESVGKATIFVTKSPEQKKQDVAEAASQKHQQQRVNENNYGSNLRIFVPDNAEQSDNFHKRSDDFDSNPDDDQTVHESDNETTAELESLRSITTPSTTPTADDSLVIDTGDSIRDADQSDASIESTSEAVTTSS